MVRRTPKRNVVSSSLAGGAKAPWTLSVRGVFPFAPLPCVDRCTCAPYNKENHVFGGSSHENDPFCCLRRGARVPACTRRLHTVRGQRSPCPGGYCTEQCCQVRQRKRRLRGYSCAGVPLFRRNGYRQSSGRKPLFRNRDTALN